MPAPTIKTTVKTNNFQEDLRNARAVRKKAISQVGDARSVRSDEPPARSQESPSIGAPLASLAGAVCKVAHTTAAFFDVSQDQAELQQQQLPQQPAHVPPVSPAQREPQGRDQQADIEQALTMPSENSENSETVSSGNSVLSGALLKAPEMAFDDGIEVGKAVCIFLPFSMLLFFVALLSNAVIQAVLLYGTISFWIYLTVKSTHEGWKGMAKSKDKAMLAVVKAILPVGFGLLVLWGVPPWVLGVLMFIMIIWMMGNMLRYDDNVQFLPAAWSLGFFVMVLVMVLMQTPSFTKCASYDTTGITKEKLVNFESYTVFQNEDVVCQKAGYAGSFAVVNETVAELKSQLQLEDKTFETCKELSAIQEHINNTLGTQLESLESKHADQMRALRTNHTRVVTQLGGNLTIANDAINTCNFVKAAINASNLELHALLKGPDQEVRQTNLQLTTKNNELTGKLASLQTQLHELKEGKTDLEQRINNLNERIAESKQQGIAEGRNEWQPMDYIATYATVSTAVCLGTYLQPLLVPACIVISTPLHAAMLTPVAAIPVIGD